jgi:hypothetical protein
MATNMAVKRFKKAQKRKQVVAVKRQADAVDGGLPARVLRAAQAPIQHCLLTESLFGIGLGTLVVTRGATPHHLAMSSFLIDVNSLGVKDVMFKFVDSNVLEMYMDTMEDEAPLTSVDPSYARKLLREVAAWSQSVGFAQHRDFAAVERIFGDVNADASDAVFQFGFDGKPL